MHIIKIYFFYIKIRFILEYKSRKKTQIMGIISKYEMGLRSLIWAYDGNNK